MRTKNTMSVSSKLLATFVALVLASCGFNQDYNEQNEAVEDKNYADFYNFIDIGVSTQEDKNLGLRDQNRFSLAMPEEEGVFSLAAVGCTVFKFDVSTNVGYSESNRTLNAGDSLKTIQGAQTTFDLKEITCQGKLFVEGTDAGEAFDTWESGDIATFESGSETMFIKYLSDCKATACNAGDQLKFGVSAFNLGADQSAGFADYGETISFNANGALSPDYNLYGFKFDGVNEAAPGRFKISQAWQCNVASAGPDLLPASPTAPNLDSAKCGGVTHKDHKLAWVDDPDAVANGGDGDSTLTKAELDSAINGLVGGLEKTVNALGQLEASADTDETGDPNVGASNVPEDPDFAGNKDGLGIAEIETESGYGQLVKYACIYKEVDVEGTTERGSKCVKVTFDAITYP